MTRLRPHCYHVACSSKVSQFVAEEAIAMPAARLQGLIFSAIRRMSAGNILLGLCGRRADRPLALRPLVPTES
jgi:hypothetical protein